MLLSFYLLSLSFILPVLVVSLIQKKREKIIRSLTLLVILHILCLAIWQGISSFILFVTSVLCLSVYELSSYYKINCLIGVLINVLVFEILVFNHNQQMLQWAIVSFFIISVVTFTANKVNIRTILYLFGFSTCFLITCSIFLIELFKINSKTIILIFLLLQLNDSFSYLFGKKFGRTKLFPTISPNKTLEGYLCGAVGIILGIFLLHTLIPILSKQTFVQDITIFLVVLVFANMGDLLLSSLKRKLGIKDFSHILAGHGGVLDRFDNIFFVAPIFYLLFACYFTIFN